jgi:WD40 repeat protein
MAKFADILAKNANDPDANVEMGKYYCLIKGNWEKGLPMLLKGQDKVYTDLAKRDLAGPKDTHEQLDLGDDYATLAENEKGLTQKMLLKRTMYWYARCLPGLQSGLNKVRVEKSIEEISKLFPSGQVIGVGSAVITAHLRNFDKGHFNGIQCLAVSNDGKFVMSGGIQEPSPRLWDFAKGTMLKQFTGHKDEIWGVAFSHDAKVVASASTDMTLKTWDPASGNNLRTFIGHKDWVRGVFFMPDQKHIITASDDNRIVIWDLANGAVVKQMQGHTNFINGFAMTKDGKRAVTGSDDNTTRVWDLGTGQEIAKFFHNTQVWSVAISNDGKKVLSAGNDSNVRVWDVDNKMEIRTLPHPARIWAMAFSPDGKVLVTGTGGQVNQIPKEINFGPNPPQFNQQDNCLYFWEFPSGKFLRRLTGHTNVVRALVWTPDGRHVISGGQDNSIRVWGEGKK